MDSRLVREGILTHNGFIGLRAKRNDSGEELAGRINVLGDDLGLKRQADPGGS